MKRLDKDEIKKQLIESIATNSTVKIEELNKRADKVEKPEDAANIIKQYEEILQTKGRVSSQSRFIKGRFLNASKRKRCLCRW